MLLQFDLKHIHKVNFYPSDNNFTQALLGTNIISNYYNVTNMYLGWHRLLSVWQLIVTIPDN